MPEIIKNLLNEREELLKTYQSSKENRDELIRRSMLSMVDKIDEIIYQYWKILNVTRDVADKTYIFMQRKSKNYDYKQYK